MSTLIQFLHGIVFTSGLLAILFLCTYIVVTAVEYAGQLGISKRDDHYRDLYLRQCERTTDEMKRTNEAMMCNVRTHKRARELRSKFQWSGGPIPVKVAVDCLTELIHESLGVPSDDEEDDEEDDD